jgi:Family of unknown function (DUF6448)
MPPHCDSLDGPVVRAAFRALEAEDVDVVLPYVHEEGEAEVRRAFELAVKARSQGVEAREVADRYFFETAVRVHRTGEGAPFTGLKPAGLDVGPVIPLAESAIAAGEVTPLADFLSAAVRDQTVERFNAMLAAHAGVDAARAYVQTMLGLQVWAHKLYQAVHADAARGTDSVR